MIKIEKGIPIPVKQIKYKAGGAENSYEFHKLGVGDNLYIPVQENQIMNNIQLSILSCIRAYCKSNPKKKFTTRKYDNFIRVWRTQ